MEITGVKKEGKRCGTRKWYLKKVCTTTRKRIIRSLDTGKINIKRSQTKRKDGMRIRVIFELIKRRYGALESYHKKENPYVDSYIIIIWIPIKKVINIWYRREILWNNERIIIWIYKKLVQQCEIKKEPYQRMNPDIIPYFSLINYKDPRILPINDPSLWRRSLEIFFDSWIVKLSAPL